MRSRQLPAIKVDGSDGRRAGKRYLVFGSPQLLEPEIEEVLATLRSGWIGTGPRVAALEES
ncbi:MAG: UDP-4-amino-4,6-dideoxy-N-acetyl-beta-L-altrosamine transaminase, partial [Actinomycetia bacterium]|nr:UDP-4-amino-4,6-dideoxy-N-acetyl-beta-L-altrosamine transaminase [Actinomycetes bacterium]